MNPKIEWQSTVQILTSIETYVFKCLISKVLICFNYFHNVQCDGKKNERIFNISSLLLGCVFFLAQLSSIPKMSLQYVPSLV